MSGLFLGGKEVTRSYFIDIMIYLQEFHLHFHKKHLACRFTMNFSEVYISSELEFLYCLGAENFELFWEVGGDHQNFYILQDLQGRQQLNLLLCKHAKQFPPRSLATS